MSYKFYYVLVYNTRNYCCVNELKEFFSPFLLNYWNNNAMYSFFFSVMCSIMRIVFGGTGGGAL